MPAKTETPTKEGEKAPSRASDDLSIEKRVDELEELILLQNDAMDELKKIFESVQEKTGPGVQAPQVSVPEGIEEKLAALDEVNKKLSEIGEMKQGVEQKVAELGEMKRSIEEMASEIFLIKGKLVTASAQTAEAKNTELEEMFNRHFAELKEKIESAKRNFSSTESRISAMESALKAFSGEVQNVKSSSERIGKIESDVSSLKSSRGNRDELKSVFNDFRSLSERVGRMEGSLKEIASTTRNNLEAEKIKTLEQSVNGLRNILPEVERVKVLEQRVNNLQNTVQKPSASQNLEQKFQKLQEEVKNATFQSQEPVSVLNIQMSDMLGKIIGIEMRLAVVEKNLEKFMKVQPVVLE
jgi:methyl-accepting chemotaxis protein